MERVILEQTLHSKEDRRSLLNFLVSKATDTVAFERISMANTAECVSADIVANRKKGFDDLLAHETATLRACHTINQAAKQGC